MNVAKSIKYDCGCENAYSESGVLRYMVKCAFHVREKPRLEDEFARSYYESLGIFADGIPQVAPHVEQMRLGLDDPPLGCYPVGALAIEVGCGCSMYAPWLMRLGYRYQGVEPCAWAARWTATAFDTAVVNCRVEDFEPREQQPALILAAHVLEHLEDAPGQIGRMTSWLAKGGLFIILVPDDSDPVNPDHKWFFTEKTLHDTMRESGLEVRRIKTVQVVRHEKFIYALGRRR